MIIDGAGFVGYGRDRIGVQLYNPTEVSLWNVDVIWRVKVYDPALKTTFDRRYRGTIYLSALAQTSVDINIGLVFGPGLQPEVCAELAPDSR